MYKPNKAVYSKTKLVWNHFWNH